MSSTPFEPHFTVDNRRFAFIPADQWTYREARTAKAIAGGLSVTEIETGVAKADPDAMLAAMVVSAQRVDPRASVDWFLDGRVVAFFEDMVDEALEDQRRRREEASKPAEDPTPPELELEEVELDETS